MFLLISPILYMLIDSLEASIVFFIIIYIVNPHINNLIAKLLPISEDHIVYNAYAHSFMPSTQLLIFILGIVLYFCARKLKGQNIRNKKLLSYSLLVFGSFLLFGQIILPSSLYNFQDREMFALYFFIIILSQAISGTIIIDNHVFRFIGRYSYGIYLFQFIWFNIYDNYLSPMVSSTYDWIAKFAISVIALLVISYSLTRFYDTPLQKLANVK